MSRRLGKLGTKSLARKKAKLDSPALAASWQSLLTHVSELFEYVGSLDEESEELQEACASAAASFRSSLQRGRASHEELNELTRRIAEEMETLSGAAQFLCIDEEDDDEETKQAKLDVRSNVTEVNQAMFTVMEEALAHVQASLPVTTETASLLHSYSSICCGLLNSIWLASTVCIQISPSAGWRYFDTIAERFFTAATTNGNVHEPLRYTAVVLITLMFRDDRVEMSRYLEFESSARSVTLLCDWIWLLVQDTRTEDTDEMIRIILLATWNTDRPQESIFVDALIEKVNRALSVPIPSAIAAGAGNAASAADGVAQSDRGLALRFLSEIQTIQAEATRESKKVHASHVQLTVTPTLLLRHVNSPECARAVRRTALACLVTLAITTEVRDQLIELNQFNPILQAIIPYLLGTKDIDQVTFEYPDDLPAHGQFDSTLASLFRVLMCTEEKSYVKLKDLPQELLLIDSPQCLIKPLFARCITEVRKASGAAGNGNDAESSSEPNPREARAWTQTLFVWHDMLVYNQWVKFDGEDEEENEDEDGMLDEEAQKARDEKKAQQEAERHQKNEAIMADGKSEYMTFDLLKEMYLAFLPYSMMLAGSLTSLPVFEFRSIVAVLCARFLNDLVVPNEFIESRMPLLSRMLTACMNYSPASSNNFFHMYKSIFARRASIQRAYQQLAQYEFKRQPDIVATQMEFIERALSSQYGQAEEANCHFDDGEVEEEEADKARIELERVIDDEQAAALKCFQVMIGRWNIDELAGAHQRIFALINTSFHKYQLEAMKEVMEVISILITRLKLFGQEKFEPERGVDATLTPDAQNFITSARQLLFDVILHTPRREVCQLAFDELQNMIGYVGQIAFTKGTIRMHRPESPTDDAAAADAAALTQESSILVPVMQALKTVCESFLLSRLPCQIAEFRQAVSGNRVAYMDDDVIAHARNVAKEGEEDEDEEESEEGEEGQKASSSSDILVIDNQDESPDEYFLLIVGMYDMLEALSNQLPASQFISSLLTPLMPAIREFYPRTLNHLVTTAVFFDALHSDALGVDLDVFHEDMILIFAHCLTDLEEDQTEAKTFGRFKKTAREILAQGQLDLKSILEEEDVRTKFQAAIAE